MKFCVDKQYLLDTFKEMVSVHSPTEYHQKFDSVLKKYAENLGYCVTSDNKNTVYISIDGQDNSKSVMLSAHADTVGLLVRAIMPNGTLRVKAVGGLNFATVDGESVVIYTRDGREYTGLIICEKHSTHVFSDASKTCRNADTMMVIIDEKVDSAEDVRALGIEVGDYVCIEPRCQITQSGFIKSRFIDNKGAIASVFAAIKYLKGNNLKPKYNTVFSFPYCEEIGIGGRYVPEGISEYVGVDIGLIGPEQNGSEYAVSICAGDIVGPYSYDLTSRIINYAKKAGCDYRVDTYRVYSSDANSAARGGNNVSRALFGMAVYGSHGMERTHVDSLLNTSALILAYVLDI